MLRLADGTLLSPPATRDLARLLGLQTEYEQIIESAMDEDKRLKARTELGERYGVSWHDERIPEAMARFGIGP